MKRYRNNIIVLLMIFCMMFTMMPVVSGEANAQAASKFTLSVKVTDTNVNLKWTKASGKYMGYAVFRDGILIKNVSRKVKSFTDKSADEGTHAYMVKTYKVKKQKQWLNKKTGKWQKKKPKKKYCGKSRTVKVYKYGKKTPKKTVTISAAASVSLDAPVIKVKYDGVSEYGSEFRQVTVSWNAVANAKSYIVTVNGKEACTTTELTHTDGFYKPNKTYKFVVYAVRGKTKKASEAVSLKIPSSTLSDSEIASIEARIAEIDEEVSSIDSQLQTKKEEKADADKELASAKAAYDDAGRAFVNKMAGDHDVEYFIEGAKWGIARGSLKNVDFNKVNDRLTVHNVRRAIQEVRYMNQFRKSEDISEPLTINPELMAFAPLSGMYASGKQQHIFFRLISGYYAEQAGYGTDAVGSEMLLVGGVADESEWTSKGLLWEKNAAAEEGLTKENCTSDYDKWLELAGHYNDAIQTKWKSAGTTFVCKGGGLCFAYSEDAGMDIDDYESALDSFVHPSEVKYNAAKSVADKVNAEVTDLESSRAELIAEREKLAEKL